MMDGMLGELHIGDHSHLFLDDEIIQDVIGKLKALQSNSDIESAHNQADKILCDLLNSLGYTAVVNEFENLEKWYA